MIESHQRILARMDFILEETCGVFTHGGDHERRKYIAQKLKLSAKRGNTTLTGLRAVAQAALQDLTAEGRLRNLL